MFDKLFYFIFWINNDSQNFYAENKIFENNYETIFYMRLKIGVTGVAKCKKKKCKEIRGMEKI